MTHTAVLEAQIIDQDEKTFLRFFNKALIFQANDQYEQAIEYYEKAVSIKPDHLPTRQVLGFLYQACRRYSEALEQYKQAILLHKYSATLHNSAGLCEEHCNNLPAAKRYFQTAIDLKQNNPQAFNNLGNVCRKLGEYSKAEEYLLTALRLNISVETLANLGMVMNELGNLSLCLSFYEHALRLQPDNAKLNWNKSLTLLAQGKFDQGWYLYDQGKIAKTRPKQISPKITDKADFSVDYFRDKTVYIRGEQGIGDEIMFASCFADIISVSKYCHIECDERLVPLFQRSFPDANIVAEYDSHLINQKSGASNEKGITGTGINADIVISSASLPRFVRRSFSSFPCKNSYLYAYPKAAEQWRKRYALKEKSLNIGISWKGGLRDEARRRSTELASWLGIFQNTNVNFVNLQYGDIQNEQDIADKYLNEWSDTNHYHNLDQLAAQITALDLVITVSNATAHLAGALGVPVFVLLPHSPNWRWFMGKNPSPWYKSATLFAQKQTDDWGPVFKAVQQTLNATYLDDKRQMIELIE